MSITSKLAELYSTTKEGAVDHAPLLFTIATCVGTVLVAYEGYKFSNAVRLAKAEAEKIKKETPAEEQLTPEFKKNFRRKMIRIAGPSAIKLVASIAVTDGCAIASEKLNSDRLTEMSDKLGAMASLYNASETGKKIYEEQVEKVVGKDKAGEITQNAVTASAEKNPPMDIQNTGTGDYLYHIQYTNTWFRAGYDAVNSAFKELDIALNPESYYEEDRVRCKKTCENGYFTVRDLMNSLQLRTNTGIEDEMIWIKGMEMEAVYDYGESPTHEPCCYISAYCPPTGIRTMHQIGSLFS